MTRKSYIQILLFIFYVLFFYIFYCAWSCSKTGPCDKVLLSLWRSSEEVHERRVISRFTMKMKHIFFSAPFAPISFAAQSSQRSRVHHALITQTKPSNTKVELLWEWRKSIVALIEICRHKSGAFPASVHAWLPCVVSSFRAMCVCVCAGQQLPFFGHCSVFPIPEGLLTFWEWLRSLSVWFRRRVLTHRWVKVEPSHPIASWLVACVTFCFVRRCRAVHLPIQWLRQTLNSWGIVKQL